MAFGACRTTARTNEPGDRPVGLAAKFASNVCLLIALSFGTWATVCAEPVISATGGSHGVGLRIIQQYDRARVFRPAVDPVTGDAVAGERARPLQTLIWYPANEGGQRLRYADYVATRLTETRFDLAPSERTALEARQMAALSRRLGDEAQGLLNSSMLASRDAPPTAGKFPVVIYAAGAGGTADENADLFEYLASHGYIVISSTSLGAHGKAIAYEMEDAEPQISDIRFLLGYAQSLPEADMANVAVLGWSWGGMSNVFAAARDDRISAVISLDGTREPAFTRSIQPRLLTAPWLYFSRAPETIPQLNRSELDTSFSLLHEARFGAGVQLTMHPMRHVDFISMQQRETRASAYGEYSKEETRQAYDMVAVYIRRFLDAYLKNDLAGRAFLTNTPRENGAPLHSISAVTHLAEKGPPSQAGLAEELSEHGFGQAVQAYQAAVARDATFTLSDQELKAWGYGLLESGRPQDAGAIFELWTILYPTDWDAFDSLGEAYDAAGNPALAIENYRRSLELNPRNRNATDRLKAMAPRR